MKRLMFVLLFTILLSGCTNPDKAERVLKSNGYKDIIITGYSIFSCSKDDIFHTGFTAISPAGSRVEGTVCSGFFKGATIRLD